MATHITCHLPTDEFALNQTLSSISGISLTCERIAALGDKAVTPLLRFRGADLEPLEAALEDDPTVDEFEVLTHGREEALCYISWNSRVTLLVRMLTATEALVLSGAATKERWTFRLLFPTRDALSRLDEFCTNHNLSLDVSCVETWDGNGPDPLGLTADQYEALVTAYKHGYFKVPRDIVLDDLAVEMGISHQALSERLRRGHDTLVQRVLHPASIEPDTDDETTSTESKSSETSPVPSSRLPTVNLD
ncbi:helix-turn-helix domain-containing protein [Halocatena marina]|uniref:helix-turn-helix domain-containing protein n=1 Tax=Halocatena marina TaxID=2934937 RepID=UPI00200F30D1|nr:helix-turn-helix domain-containing protein [Halocatena marina]